MHASKYLKLNRIEFVVTYRCSGACRHCSVGDKINRTQGARHLAPAVAAEVVAQLSKDFTIKSVMTFGGEPLLYPEVVCAIHEEAGRCGIPARQLITNGYFSKSDQRQRQVAVALQAAGVTDMLLSVDAFHQESIPIEPVHSFARHAKAAGVPVRLSPAWVVNARHDDAYNRKTRQIIASFADLNIAAADGNDITMAGNAAEHLAEYYDEPNMDMAQACGAMPYTEKLTEVTALSIEPDGDVKVCGFVIGNIHRQDIREIAARYDPHRNRWMNAIVTGGAPGLLELAGQTGREVDVSRCYSVCDLCRQVTGGMKDFDL